MKTVRLVPRTDQPIIRELHDSLLRRFSASSKYRVLNGHEDRSPDVVLAFLSDPEDARELAVRRQTYQDFIGLVYLGHPDDSEAGKVLRAYESGLAVMGNLAVVVDSTGTGPHEYALTLITPERGTEVLVGSPELPEELFDTLVRRSYVTYIDENRVDADLPPSLAHGNMTTRCMSEVARRLDELDLVPAPVPLDGLSERARRRYFKVLGLRQISYGNMSARHVDASFWMTGRGVDKANLEVIGRDIVLIDRFDRQTRTAHVRVPPGFEDARASIDTSIHAVIYEGYPDIGAMIHIHAAVDDIVYTDNHYPCGTIELCDSILEGLDRTLDPNRTILGLTNHGLLVTGADVQDAWQQIEARHTAMAPAGVA